MKQADATSRDLAAPRSPDQVVAEDPECKRLREAIETEQRKLGERERAVTAARSQVDRLKTQRRKLLRPAADGDAGARAKVSNLRAEAAAAEIEAEDTAALLEETRAEVEQLARQLQAEERRACQRELARQLKARRADMMAVDEALTLFGDLVAAFDQRNIAMQDLALRITAGDAGPINERWRCGHSLWGRLGRALVRSPLVHRFDPELKLYAAKPLVEMGDEEGIQHVLRMKINGAGTDDAESSKEVA